MICIFKCVSCGDKMVFSPEKQAMVCPTCGSVCEMDTYDMADIAYDGAKSLEDGISVLHCPSCGAKVSVSQGNAKTKCGYCDAELAAFGEGEDTLCPEKIIPLKLTEDDAKSMLFKWWTQHETMPKLDMKKLKMSFKDMYVPVWLVYTDAYTDISATVRAIVGDVYSSTEFNMGIRKVVKSTYERVAFDASCHIQDEQFYNIEPFHYSDMVDFHAGYISGHMAEVYHNGPQVTLPRVIRRVKDFAIKMIKEDIESDSRGGDIQSVVHQECDVTPSELVYLLVPVWVCRYEYEGKKRYVYINGQTGKVDGEVLFTGKVHERHIIEYAISALLVGAVTGLFASSLILAGQYLDARSMGQFGAYIVFFLRKYGKALRKDSSEKLSTSEEIQLRHGMVVTAGANVIANVVLAFVVGLMDLIISIPSLRLVNKMSEGMIFTLIIAVVMAVLMTSRFARKLTNFETYTKKTRYIDYIKYTDCRELVKEIW